MANKKITMRNHNGTTWDEMHPKTVAEQVVESTEKSFVSAAEKSTWNSKANGTHTHPISDVTGLQTALDEKAPTSHTHTLAQVSGVGTAASKDVGTASGNVPVLDGSGKLNTAVLPAIAINDTFVVASQTAMLALTAEVGDIAVRTDLNKSFILKTAGAATLANWQELLTPTDSVTSVAGRTGAVTLTKTDVGLSNVANESKATMFTSPTFTGTPTAPTPAASNNTTQVATTAFVQAAVQTVSSSMPKITVSATQPASPTVGDFWYEETV